MGYRILLKKYINHINELVGSDLVEIAAITNAMKKRELGELRTLAAEIKREPLDNSNATQYRKIVRSLVDRGVVSLEELDQVHGIEPQESEQAIPDEQFRRILIALVASLDSKTKR
ncbi:MAG: hypothetical protein AAF541_13770 [Pseudomonadota bacterium]